jgi:uncharacterized protein DUF3592
VEHAREQVNMEAGAWEPVQERRALPRFGVARLVWATVVAGFVLACSIWLIAGGLHTRSLERPVAGGLTVTGTVIDVRVTHEKGYVYQPIVSFRDKAGRTVVFTAPGSSKEPTPGRAASVSYNPSHPLGAHDLSDSALAWQAPVYAGLFVLFIALIVPGLVILAIVRKRRAGTARPGDAVGASPFG